MQLQEDGYTITTHHNGLGVTVADELDGASFYAQGEDAAQFLDDWNAWDGDFASFIRAFGYDDLLLN